MERCAIQRMTSIEYPASHIYLDATDLADILGLSARTIILRARHRPWLLPPRAELFDRELLRWRQDVVARWILESPTSTN
jgi:hypothetical protein